MGMMTLAPPRRQEAPGPPGVVTPGSARHWLARLGRACRRPEAWYAGFTLYAAAMALLSGPGLDHYWGIWASGGYGAAAAVSWRWPSRRGRAAALAAAVAGALAGPAAWLAVCAPATPDVTVVSRGGLLLLQHGSPYLAGTQLAHGGFLAYNPYLPVMAVFGLPHALGLPGLAGDPRPYLAAATAGLLAAAFWVVFRSRPEARQTAAFITGGFSGAAWAAAAFAVASPVMALSIAVGVTDGPIIAFIILAMALAVRRGGPAWPAAVILGVACAMKYTAWPALAVLVAVIATRDGARAAARFAAAALATAAALVVALSPAAFTGLAGLTALAANTIGYPLGLTRTPSPAQSPLPGHLLTTLGPAGHAAALALLAVAGLAIAVWVVVRPPATVAAAALRLALLLTLLFTFAPATRFGYFDYPLALCGWVALTALPEWSSRRSQGQLRRASWSGSGWTRRPVPGSRSRHAPSTPGIPGQAGLAGSERQFPGPGTSAPPVVPAQVHQGLADVGLGRGPGRPPVPHGAQHRRLQQVLGMPAVPTEQVRPAQQHHRPGPNECFKLRMFPHATQNAGSREPVATPCTGVCPCYLSWPLRGFLLRRRMT